MQNRGLYLFILVPSYPVLSTNEIPAKLWLSQKTVRVTIFWPLNVKVKQIKCMKFDDNIRVIFITLSHNQARKYNLQELPLMRWPQTPLVSIHNPQGVLNPLTRGL